MPRWTPIVVLTSAALCAAGAIAMHRPTLLLVVMTVVGLTFFWRPSSLALQRERQARSPELDGLLLWLALVLVPTLLWWFRN